MFNYIIIKIIMNIVNNMFVLLILILLIMNNNNIVESFGYNSYCNCTRCGYCVSDKGNGECVPGDIRGPYFRDDCIYWEYNPFYKRRYVFPYYYPFLMLRYI